MADTNQKNQGSYHPLTIAMRDLEKIFRGMGFTVASGPEMESEWYNFDALNIPADHPARDLWDTFWLKPTNDQQPTTNNKGAANSNNQEGRESSVVSRELLRTHTSPVQVRYMENNKPPIAIIAPGKTFRYEATDATHETQFYQLEGLLIDKGVTLGHLKGVLAKFLGEFFGTDANVRLRPSYFPFVEPGVEVDMSCFACKAGETGADSRRSDADLRRQNKSCSVCKGTGWVEVMGAGMVHPKVLSNVGIDPKIYQGFALGAGIDRLIMLKYGIDDIRLLYNGDLRLTTQF